MEAIDLDLDALLAEGPLVVEWAQKIITSLPKDHLLVKMSHMQEELRRMKFTANGNYYEDLLSSLQEIIYRGT
jgi:tRNA A37 threonylcarbamoyladenosine biosynthesis protein TsaE